jgi:hypothetical protein
MTLMKRHPPLCCHRINSDHPEPEPTLRVDVVAGDGPNDLPGVHAKHKVTTGPQVARLRWKLLVERLAHTRPSEIIHRHKVREPITVRG